MELCKEFTSSTQGMVVIPADDNGVIVERCQDDAPVSVQAAPQSLGQEAPVPVPDVALPTIPSDFIVQIQGRPFVTFPGLLHLAHQQGLLSLTEEVTHVTDNYVMAQARVNFTMGECFGVSAIAARRTSASK